MALSPEVCILSLNSRSYEDLLFSRSLINSKQLFLGLGIELSGRVLACLANARPWVQSSARSGGRGLKKLKTQSCSYWKHSGYTLHICSWVQVGVLACLELCKYGTGRKGWTGVCFYQCIEHKTVSTQAVCVLALYLRPFLRLCSFIFAQSTWIQKELGGDGVVTSYGKFLLIDCGTIGHDSEEQIAKSDSVYAKLRVHIVSMPSH